MKEKPIIFSTLMVQAILEGRKSQTRRIMKPQPEYRANKSLPSLMGTFTQAGWNLDDRVGMKMFIEECPYGEPGDVLWVRESFQDWYHKIHYTTTAP
jgi:hypothetical protein